MKFAFQAVLACVALQACTAPAPPQPAQPMVPQPVVQSVPAPSLPATAPPSTAPAAPASEAARLARNAEAPPDPRALCDGRAAGDRVQMRGAEGETVAGICRRGANGWLRFNPDVRR